METKTCKDCGETKVVELFRPKSRQCKDCRKAYLQGWEQTNREKRTADKIAWQKTHPEKFREINSRTKKKNRDRVYAEHRRRRAAKHGAGGSHTEQEWLSLCAQYGSVCLCCREEKPLTRDHVVAISKGGTDNIDNIQPLCRSCNSAKGIREIDYRVNFAFE